MVESVLIVAELNDVADFNFVKRCGFSKRTDTFIFGYEIVEKISEIMNYPIEPSIGYPTPGSFGTWAGIEKEILTITLELDEEVDVNELKEPVFKVFEYLEGVECKI